jgi:hypothetical protein
MCFQASLTNQFNFMQKAWAKEQNFVKRDVGTDVVIGVEKTDDGGKAIKETYNWPTDWDTAGKTEATFDHWVTMRGGEFFFAPSMSFLRKLAIEPSRNIVFRGVPKQEIEAAKKIIAELQLYEQKNWAIGLHGDTRQPDGFLTFFNQRKLPFSFYLLNEVGLGTKSAYFENIGTLNKYIKDVCLQEIDASEYKVAELKEYQSLKWAIGLNGDSEQPDGFVNFFGERKLRFEFYVRSIPNPETGKKGVSMGDASAYDKNIDTLNEYITELNDYIRFLKHVRLVAKDTNNALSVADGEANVFSESQTDNNPSQLWLVQAAEDGYSFLISKPTGQVLNVDGSSNRDGANVILFAHNGGNNQKWRLNKTADGYYYLVAKHSNLALTMDSRNLIQSQYKSENNHQKWKIEMED